MKTLAVMLFAFFLVSCSATVPVISNLPNCNVDRALLAECLAPEKENSHKTYRELIINYQKDRQKLQQCVIRQQALATSLKACNQHIDALNKEIVLINKSLKKRSF
jgi:hypothetical protein